jgi:hypothetical protein
MIDPAGIPRIEGDMVALMGHADSMGSSGTGFADTGARIDQTWQRLAPVYSAPESGQLLAATGPVRSISASVGEDLQDAAAALRAYASETADIQSRLEVLRGDASTLVTAYEAVRDESSTVTLDDRGAEIGAAVAAQMAAWEDAQRRCAAALQALTGGSMSPSTLVEHDYGNTVYPGAPRGRIWEVYPVDEGPPPTVVDPPLVLGPEILINVPAPPVTGVVDGPGSYVPLPGTSIVDGPGSFVPPPFGPGGLIIAASTPEQPIEVPPPVDVDGQWEAANGEKPDPESIAIGESRAHILFGDGDDDGGGHRFDSGVPGKTVFPEDWGDDQITDNILDVARNPENPPVFNESRGVWTVSGVRDGVAIEVIVKPDGGIITGHPTGGPGVHVNDVNGDPQPI